MSDEVVFTLPEVNDEDIRRVRHLLGLPADAFCGRDGADPRQDALKSMEPIDIAACPGSGKTMLLVAKLAILAEKWRYPTRGICVLSHTNVARREIEARLGNATAGRRLLAYPHHVGTIHGFVNEFLAMPWLRSNGYPIKFVDTGRCRNRRWQHLPQKTKVVLEKAHYDAAALTVKATDFSVGELRWGKGVLGRDTSIYADIRNACRQATTEGYFCHEEMFTWAHDLMDKMPTVVHVIRDRFPLLFVDEAQDNSEDQAVILKRVFFDGEGSVVRQRFGDENQAIFDSLDGEETTTDVFPGTRKMELPNSHRFGPRLAKLANPFGATPLVDGLKGEGPARKSHVFGTAEGRHTIFLFDDLQARRVLDAYGELLLETFSEEQLREGTFTAVGLVHRSPTMPAAHKFPHHVADYWLDYDPDLASRDPRPQAFVQYLWAGMAMAEAAGEAYLAVEKIADGVLRLIELGRAGTVRPGHSSGHRHISSLLAGTGGAREHYNELVDAFALNKEKLTERGWRDRWEGIVREVGESLAGGPLAGQDVQEFLSWRNAPDGVTSPATRRSRDNMYRYPLTNPKVNIRVGSIHSVKGETHTATLVLETFWYVHSLECLRPWLSGAKHGLSSKGQGQAQRAIRQERARLKLHYVAMTRATHLLCLAMKYRNFTNATADLDKVAIQELERQGWQIRLV